MDSEKSANNNKNIQKQIAELQKELAKMKAEDQNDDWSNGAQAPAPQQGAQAVVAAPPIQQYSYPTHQSQVTWQPQPKSRGQGRGKSGGGRGKYQCSNCGKFGHRCGTCTKLPQQQAAATTPPPPPPSTPIQEMHINAINAVMAKGIAKASFGDKSVPCALDTSVQRSMIDPTLILGTAVEPFDNDMAWRGRPLDAAVGQHRATFCIDKQLITASVDVVPGIEGLTLGTDWLNDSVREWDLDTGKVNTYAGSFQIRMLRDVQMLRATSPGGLATHTYGFADVPSSQETSSCRIPSTETVTGANSAVRDGGTVGVPASGLGR